MNCNTDSNKNDTNNESNDDIATDILEDLITNEDDPATIQELMEQIIEQNKSNSSGNTTDNANNTDKTAETDLEEKYISDPVMNEDLVAIDYARAMEDTPEFFVQIDMIYISCSINDNYITAFIDTGAQVSIMNLETAVKCGLYERINTKHKGTVIGVGSQESVGYVYHVEIILGQYVVPCNFMILRHGPNIIIGLNFMKTHKISLDMGSNLLKIGNQEIPFLDQKDVVDGHLKKKEHQE